MTTTDFVRDAPTDIRKVNDIDAAQKGDCIRLYHSSPDGWTLQVRGPMKLANGREGRDFIVAGSYLSTETLLALRTAIDEQLREQGVAP